jgi:hypothetical protein
MNKRVFILYVVSAAIVLLSLLTSLSSNYEVGVTNTELNNNLSVDGKWIREPHPDDYSEIIFNNNGNHRSLQDQTSPYFDPRTETVKESTHFIVPEADLDTMKHAEPTVIRSNPTYVTHSCPTKTDGNCNGSCDCRFSWPTNVKSIAPWKSSQAKCRCKMDLPAHNGMVVDVLSIGSKSRPEFVSTFCYASISCKAYSFHASKINAPLPS